MDIYNIDTYFYDLPKELIANEPKSPRDESRMVVVNRKEKSFGVKSSFKSLLDLVGDDWVIVVNDTKVYPARVMVEKKGTGAKVEMLFLKCGKDGWWEAMCKKASRVKPGDIFLLKEGKNTYELLVSGFVNDKVRLIDVGMNESVFLDLLGRVGRMPLPPYIKLKDETDYQVDYQTVYANHIGSVAAPTAGFHFTNGLMDNLKKRGVILEKVTLHVGLGTFLPVVESDIRKHKMHSEKIMIDKTQIVRLNSYKQSGKKILAVGTTSVRYLESLATSDGHLALNDLSETDLFVYPGYKFRFVDSMITNFHLPKSTLLMLVAGFLCDGGNFSGPVEGVDFLKRIYRKAIKENMRFYSFGDAMYIY